MCVLEEGRVYMLPLENRMGIVGELPFLVRKIIAHPAPGKGVKGRVMRADRRTFSQDEMRYAITIEGPVSFGVEENSGCFVTTEYILARARPVEDEVQKREFLALIGEWVLLNRTL